LKFFFDKNLKIGAKKEKGENSKSHKGKLFAKEKQAKFQCYTP